MAGLTLQPIREALVEQIVAYVARGTTGHAYDPGSHTLPAVVVRAGDPYCTYFETFGTNGVATIRLDVDIELAAAQSASAAIAMDDYLSVGSAETSSVIDAIHSDVTLGGTVATCICQTSDPPVERDDGTLVGTVHVEIKVHKIGATV